MDENSIKLIIVFIGSFIVLVVLVRALVGIDKGKMYYDEMQLLYRNKAYKLGFFSTIIMVLLAMVTEGLFGDFLNKYITQQMIYLIVLCVGFSVFVIYSIIYDAFFMVNQKKRYYIMLCLTVLFGNVAALISTIREKRFMLDGKLGVTNGGTQFALFFLFSAILIAILVKTIRERKVETE